MDRLFGEILVSIAASAIMAFMVAVGGTAMAGMPSDDAASSEMDRRDPMLICTVDAGLVYCFRAET